METEEKLIKQFRRVLQDPSLQAFKVALEMSINAIRILVNEKKSLDDKSMLYLLCWLKVIQEFIEEVENKV